MIIGIVVNVLEEEHQEQNRMDGEPTLKEIQQELREVKAMLAALNKNNGWCKKAVYITLDFSWKLSVTLKELTQTLIEAGWLLQKNNGKWQLSIMGLSVNSSRSEASGNLRSFLRLFEANSGSI